MIIRPRLKRYTPREYTGDVMMERSAARFPDGTITVNVRARRSDKPSGETFTVSLTLLELLELAEYAIKFGQRTEADARTRLWCPAELAGGGS